MTAGRMNPSRTNFMPAMLSWAGNRRNVGDHTRGLPMVDGDFTKGQLDLMLSEGDGDTESTQAKGA